MEEDFEDTKGIIRIVHRRRTDNTMAKRKSTKGQTTIYNTYTQNRQHYGQKKKYKRTNNYPQNIHIKLKIE